MRLCKLQNCLKAVVQYYEVYGTGLCYDSSTANSFWQSFYIFKHNYDLCIQIEKGNSIMDFGVAISVFLFILYWWQLPQLVDVILEAPRFKKNHWLLIGILNAVIVFYAYATLGIALLSYGIMMLLMLIEFLIFYKDKFSGALLCALACAIHVLSVFTITIASLAIITENPPYEIITNYKLFSLVAIISFGILNMIILGAIKLVPLTEVKIINQHKDQQWFIIAWMAVNNVFLFYTITSFSHPDYLAHVSGNQIATALSALISLYIVLFFSFKTSEILGYKEKSKALEQAIYLEQQYRNSMVKDAIAYYEINITQDKVINGLDERFAKMLENASCYSEMLNLMTRKLIYFEDAVEFIKNHGRANIIKMYGRGQSEIITEYRRLLDSGDYVWVKGVANLVEDTKTGDIKAFLCIKNIDAEKKEQLELQRLAERDSLTGLYNKSMTSKLIDEHLSFSQSPIGSAFFMIDVDDFKEINDHLGHVYGDAVLCELADKLVQIFRSNDIVGRIGGDEFIVFLKDGAMIQKVKEKAEEICKAFHIAYKGVDGEEYTISSSIGISFFPKDGESFKDLYSHADIALYAAKNGGKNTYSIFDGRSFTGYTSQRTEIEPFGNPTQKGFRRNRIEYVFKMLYHSENSVAAIHSALELIASHFSFERGYIFETSKDGKTTSNTFEWCAEGVTPELDNLQKLPVEVVSAAHASFQKDGTFILKSLNDLRPVERDVLEPQGIKSMFQFGIFDKSRLLGFIGFDNCKSETVPCDTDIDEIETICNILATFFVKQHIDEAAAKDLLTRQEVMNHLDNYIYVVEVETYEVLFMNEKIHRLMDDKTQKNPPCYSFFRGKTKQCEDCPVQKLKENKLERMVCEIYNEKLNIWMETTASTLSWTDGSLACLVNCTDITKQKEAHLSHIRQLENLAYVDELTGCRTYYKFKEDALKILQKQQDISHFLVKLDIENFKLINQIYGYAKGNEILCCLAKAMEETTRNENEIFARVGNDEFIALFSIQEDVDAEKIYQDFLQHFYTLVGSDFVFKCNFPHGRYIIYPNNINKLDVNDMFEKANIAHKTAKLDKTLEYVYYDDSMTKEALHAKEIENKMEDALANNEFIVYLQPKYYLDSETIGGAEALTRWKNSNVDLFFPNTFIPIFEQNGFIIKLDFYIFKKVCHIIKEWIQSGIEPVVVSVNFSRLHLGNVNFVKELCEIVDNVGIQRRLLEIEITETVIYDNIETLEILLNELHTAGFSMSMDDFGSGYSSLGMLKNLQVDVIKMDRSFFANQKDVVRSKTVVGSVIQMAAGLGIRTVAEGVEDQEHIDFLRELNCDMVQGYYYAKPMDVEAFTALIINK